jgi:hypothetical protein
MKKNTLVLIGAILVIAAVWSGVGAMASPQHQQASAGLNARVRALEANVRSLKSQMASTKKKVNALVGAQACLTAQGLSQYGNATTTGYYYTNDQGVTTILTHATDFDAGSAPTAWMARVDPGCVTGGSSESMQNFRYERSTTVTPKSDR